MHNVRLIRRRFPQQADRITWVLAAVSASGVAFGLGLLLLH